MDFNKGLPIIMLDVDMKDMYSGMEAISFVDAPATELNWNKFSNDIPHMFKKDEYKRCVTGPIMVADTPIYRYSKAIGDYYCKFTSQTIFNMMIKYFTEGKQNRVNEMHTSNRPVDNVYLVEHYFVGDRVKSELYDVKPGSSVGTFYIKDEKYWNEYIMTDKFKGFSLEGFFNEQIENMATKKIYEKMKSEVLNDRELEEFIKFRINKILDSNEPDFVKESQIKSLVNLHS